jgi:hypothetical protein
MYQFCEGIISIYPEIPKPEAGKPFHKNIRIEDNEFHPFDYPLLYAMSVEGLSFTGNSIILSTMYKPFHKRKSGLTFDACTGVTIRGNKFSGEVLGKTVDLLNMKKTSFSLSRDDPYKIAR